MQTFLPFPDFQQSAAVLDRVRLGKQRVEALQILRALVIPEYGWQSHPAIRMWMGYVPALTMYGLAMVDEWTARGGEDTTREKIMEFAPQAAHPDYAAKIPMPPWLGNEDFHLSHRSRLIAKDPRFYTEVFPGTDPDLEYIWPEPKHELVPEDPAGDRMWVLRLPLGHTEPAQLKTVSLPPVGRSKAPADDDYQFVYADSGSRRPSKVRKLPPKQLVKKPTRKRQQQEEAFTTLPGNSVVAIPVNDGAAFAVGKVLGRPITVDGQFARNFQVDEIVDRSAFDYPALMQDPRAFFPIPAR
ncbi:MSMEG_6728 family protein [Arthrobacter sp. 131MFCol6.1]|uniref:MSMEG_6728 family protein n=1 Tax=Arthrobacter sp. 131MFCol6.1 TaxID=1157944 RepID=UPI000372BFD4|nr:MSMEG_6728 family protein [Arthrobacter sp. 131MFCol6.1]